jgi:hypothetical protein
MKQAAFVLFTMATLSCAAYALHARRIESFTHEQIKTQLPSRLPAAKEIVERYDQALGGRDALLRHTSSTMRGTMEVQGSSGPLGLPFVFFASAPYRRLERVSLPNKIGDVLNGFDGETAWSFDPRSGAQVYTGTESESMKRDADFYYPINELSWFKSMDTVGIEDFEGRPCYRLHGINNWNKSNDHFYDRETNLLAGYEFESELGLTHEVFADYKKLDGVLVPLKQIVKVHSKDGAWAVQQTLQFESVTFNDVDPAVFAVPAPVRDLLAKAKPAASRE